MKRPVAKVPRSKKPSVKPPLLVQKVVPKYDKKESKGHDNDRRKQAGQGRLFNSLQQAEPANVTIDKAADEPHLSEVLHVDNKDQRTSMPKDRSSSSKQHDVQSSIDV